VGDDVVAVLHRSEHRLVSAVTHGSLTAIFRETRLPDATFAIKAFPALPSPNSACPITDELVVVSALHDSPT